MMSCSMDITAKKYSTTPFFLSVNVTVASMQYFWKWLKDGVNRQKLG